MNSPTRGVIESEIASAVVRFQREQHGRGAAEVRAHVIGDLVLVRCNDIFTPAEARLAATEEGRKLIRKAREELWAINHSRIEDLVHEISGCRVVRSYSCVDVEASELVEVYVLEHDIGKCLPHRTLQRAGSRAPGSGAA